MTEKKKTQFTTEPGKQELFTIREFNAPREVVFKAFTDKNLYARWLGPRRFTTRFDVFEPRDGGSWRFVQRDQEGKEFSFHSSRCTGTP